MNERVTMEGGGGMIVEASAPTPGSSFMLRGLKLEGDGMEAVMGEVETVMICELCSPTTVAEEEGRERGGGAVFVGVGSLKRNVVLLDSVCEGNLINSTNGAGWEVGPLWWRR
jgi:hypothetical protein